ncbi:hypothetical protein ACOBWA_08340 [Psychrobacter sp. ER1]|uniref:hypothetical protein n=1 Tax=Psychrobacter sp. ER1 TaxID=3406645 RepID=UPI003B42AEF4
MDYLNKLVMMLRLYGVWVPALVVFLFLDSGYEPLLDLGMAETVAILALAGAVVGRLIEQTKLGE